MKPAQQRAAALQTLGRSLIYYFCTYFDQRYLSRGLALYKSLRRHCSSFLLYVLCLDQPTQDVLSELNYPGLRPIRLEDFESGDPALSAAKRDRTRVEYYFTCTPFLPRHIFKICPEAEVVTYLDADLFFFGDPKPIYDELGTYSIAIVGHRHPQGLEHLSRDYGLFNVGWLSFRRDDHGRACLERWRQECIQSCSHQAGNGRYADQKYLDVWPSTYPRLVVISHKGANLAPWNVAGYRLQGQTDGVTVDGQPLIFFHFHGLKMLRRWLYDTYLQTYCVRPQKALVQGVYAPYIKTLIAVEKELARLVPRGRPGNPFPSQSRNGAGGNGRRSTRDRLVQMKWRIRNSRYILGRRYLLVLGGRVL
jgi:hypothetical protein